MLNFKYRIVKREKTPTLYFQLLLPLISIIISLIISSIFLIIAKINPLNAIIGIFIGALGSKFSIYETIVKAIPIILTGTSVAIAFNGRFWNIGAEGQMYAGALGATWCGLLNLSIPKFIYIIFAIFIGFLFGSAWAFLPAFLKIKFKVDDVVTTLLLNFIMIYIVSAIVYGPWRDPISNWPQSPNLPENIIFPIIFPRSRVHIGIFIAIIFVILFYILIKKMKLGFEIKAVGSNIKASKYLGLNVSKIIIITAIISGGIAGLAGVNEILGLHYHLVDNFSPGYGYTGIVVAMLGRLEPIGVLLSSFFFASIITGSQVMSRVSGVNVYISDVIQGITLLVMLSMLLFTEYEIRRIK